MTPLQQNTSNAISNRGLIIATIMTVAILEVLDSTIVNVSLPAMMPALGANQNQITWVLTSYIVASAMVIPLTGFLSNRLGHKRLLLISITGFMVSSAACGASQSLSMMVIFRLLQGAFGATLIPLSQSILRLSFPLEEQGKAMTIWGVGIMAAPVFGPTLGGYITQNASWRWIFYINIPFCLISLALTYFIIPRSAIKKIRIDWIGIVAMFIGIGTLQTLLDQGNSKDWFTSNSILILTMISVVFLVLFMIRNLTEKYPAIKLSIYKDRNFALSSLLFAAMVGCVYGIITLQPIMLETLFNYTAMQAGLIMGPNGLSSAIGMIFASVIMKKINVKYILTVGLLFCSGSAYYLATLNLNAAMSNFIIANIIFGLGIGLFIVPMSTYALATVPKADITEASGLYSYARMLGSSIGISLLSTLVSRESQINWNRLGGHITPFSNNLRLWLTSQHLTLSDKISAPILSNTLLKQANMIAFIDAYFLIAIVLILLIPFVWMMKTVELKEDAQTTH